MVTWKDCEGGRYQVSDTGEVRNTRTQRLKRCFLNEHSYWLVALCVGPKYVSRNVFIHRLVAAAFVGPLPAGKFVNHVDGNPRNNVPSNLEYVTLQENLAHARAMGMDIRGERNGSSKLCKKDVLQIRRLAIPGARNQHQLAKQFGVSQQLISMVAARKVWTHV